jgi:trigger factor
MNITREKIDDLNGIIRVNIEKSDYESKVEKALKEHRKKATMPGFRPGMIPLGLIKKMYGKAAMVEEVNTALTQGLSNHIIDEKLNILGEPLPNEEQQKDIDWEKDTDFEFVFDIGFAPEANLSLDKRSKFTRYSITLTDEMINEHVDAYANRFGESKSVDIVEEKSTIRGNIVQLDSDGNEAENGINTEMALISVDVIKDDEIKSEFAGKKIDDEVVFDIKKAYPNNVEIAYLLNIDKEAAESIDGNFKIIIKEINSFVAAEVDAELYKKIYGDDTEITDEKAFREKVATEIAEAYRSSIDYKFATDTRDQLVAKSKMEFPIDFLKRWLKATNKKLTEDQIENDFNLFIDDLKWQIIKEELIKENELKVEESEVLGLAKEIAAAQFRQYGMFNVPDEQLEGFAKQMLTKKEDVNRLYNKKMEGKIMDVIKSKVNIEDKAISREDFEKLFA